MLRDPFYNDIIDRLNKPLDPELFERCACDLLRTIYPGLVPIRGGSDSGMDGAIADSKGTAFPLVSTTGKDVIDNLTRSINSYLSNGGSRRNVILATSQSLTQRKRKNLEERAEKLGFTLTDIRSQAAFADLLYRSPEWCRELLNLTGEPPALSALPSSNRPSICQTLIGRKDDLLWLKGKTDDLLVTGQPGCGKTFLLHYFAKYNNGLFVVDDNIERIAGCIRSQQPKVIIVDDAHIKPEFVSKLRNMRERIGADFRLIANCWTGETNNVATNLKVTSSSIRELKLLPRSEIIEVIKECGIGGPNQLIRVIIDQAEGKPGLASTLCHLCLNDDIENVVYGRALFNDVKQAFEKITGKETFPVLAAFSIGGDDGMTMQDVASELNKSILDIRTITTQLAAGGVLDEMSQNKLRVRPQELRFALVRDMFFAGSQSLPYEGLINRVSSKSEALLTLLGAKHRGARVPTDLLQKLLKETNSQESWRVYAWLGPSACCWILDNFPEKAMVIARPALNHVPEKIIPVLLDTAINDNRQLNSSPDHPLRIINDWVESAYPGTGEAIKRRKLIFKNANEWINLGGNLVIGLKAIGASLSPHFRKSETDPTDRAFTLTHGLVTVSEMKEIRQFWPELLRCLQLHKIKQWEPIREIVSNWSYLGPTSNRVSDVERKLAKQFVRQMLCDLIKIANNHCGILRWIKSTAKRKSFRISVPSDPEFEILYPIREHEDWQKREKQEVKAVDKLAKQWAAKKPQTIVKKLMTFQLEASQSGNAWSKWVPRMCHNLANTTKTPCLWIKSFLSNNADGNYIGRFLERAIEINESGWETYAHQCIKKDNTRYSAVSVLLTKDNLPDTIFEEVLNNLENLKDIVNGICIHYSLSEKTVKRLLTHENPNIASAAAIGEWTREPKGNIRESLKKEWRKTIIKCPEDEYFLSDVFKKDPSIAFDWLMVHIEKGLGNLCYDLENERLDTAIKVLDDNQKKSLLKILPDQWEYGKIARLLVNSNLELYKFLLSEKQREYLHLAPLKGHPNSDWIEKAKLALDAGHSAEDIVVAARGYSWSWGGRESNMWAEWVEKFNKLLSNSDSRIRKVGEIGLQHAKSNMKTALEQEYKEDVYGI
jgi:hypothetical protein